MSFKNILRWPFLFYIRLLSKLALKINKVQIIGVTGSAGKSSLRDMLYSAISPSFRTKTIKKGNSETGIPFGILGVKVNTYSLKNWLLLALKAPFGLFYLKNTEYLIIEYGIDDPYPPKNMDYLLSIVKPDIAILLNVYPVHTMQFEKILNKQQKNLPPDKKQKILVNAIAKQKSKILVSAPENGLAVYPKDFFYLDKIKKHIKAEMISFDMDNNSGQIKVTKKGTQVEIMDQTLNFPSYALPKYYLSSLEIVFTVTTHIGLSKKQTAKNLQSNWELPPGRATLIQGINNSIIIDSSYNSSLQPLLGMLDTLKQFKNRKVAVLGDMRELGEQAETEHIKAARKAVKIADEIILVGPLMKKYFYNEAVKKGFNKEKIHTFLSPSKAAEFVKKNIQKNDLILVKGSQNTIFLEIVVKKIMNNPKKADALLCRQSNFWKKTKNQ